MKIKDIKAELQKLNAPTNGLLEKSEFVDALVEARKNAPVVEEEEVFGDVFEGQTQKMPKKGAAAAGGGGSGGMPGGMGGGMPGGMGGGMPGGMGGLGDILSQMGGMSGAAGGAPGAGEAAAGAQGRQQPRAGQGGFLF